MALRRWPGCTPALAVLLALAASALLPAAEGKRAKKKAKARLGRQVFAGRGSSAHPYKLQLVC